jgi:hypothetical protein
MPLALAIAISALLHAAAVTMPDWDLPGAPEPEPPQLEAHLLPPPAVAAPLPEKPKPRPRRAAPREPHRIAAAPAVNADAMPAAMIAPPVVLAASAVPAAEPPLPPAPPAPPWPGKGRVRYKVTYGDGGFVIGETTQEWRVEGGRYSIRSVAEPKGLAALRGRTRTQVSEGSVNADGLQPQEFRDQREGRDGEAANFDWPGSRVVFSGGRGEGRLAPGAQDLLSVFYQLAWLAPRQDIDMTVATAGRIGRWTFEWLGEESLKLETGVIPTLHLRTRADGDTTEVWLAPAHGGLPVKIRYTDRKGDTFEQTADLMELN